MNAQKKNLEIEVKLSKENYAFWNFKMLPLLEDEELIATAVVLTDAEAAVGNNPPENLVDSARAKRAILQNVSEDIALMLMPFKTAPEMWSFLYRNFSGKNDTRKFTGIKALAQFAYSKPTLQENIQDLQILLHQTIIAAGSETFRFDELAIAMFLNCLPERFHPTRSILEQTTSELTLDKVITALNAENERSTVRETPAGFAALSNMRKCPHNRARNRCWTCDPSLHPSKVKCQDCKQVGHRSKGSAKCRFFEQEEKPIAAGAKRHKTDEDDWTPLKPFAGSAVSEPDGSQKKRKSSQHDLRFVIDSGCTQTLLRNKENLKNYTDVNFKMQTAGTDVLQCPGKGDLQINANMEIENAVYSPNAAMNLLSVSQICDLGNRVTFDKEHATVYDKSGQVILRAMRKGGLYVTKPIAKEEKGKALATKSSERTLLHHRRMGHLNIQSLRLLSHISDGILLDGNPNSLCTPCVQAKTHRASFPISHSHAKRVGDLVHTDICYLGIPTILNCFTMFILFVDDATRYTTLYLLKSKADAGEAFKDYDRKFFNMTQRHITVLHSDGAKEYFSKSIKEYCNAHGITQDCSAPYTPEQNGRAERPNRTILEGISALLLDSKLPWEFWGYAAQTFVYLKNRSPHRAIPQSTPFTEWFKKIPNLSHVRVFGTKCHMYVPSKRRTGPGSKLMPKTIDVILVGYSHAHKSYKLFDLKTMQEYLSPHVVFENETITDRTLKYSKTFVEHIDKEKGSYPSKLSADDASIVPNTDAEPVSEPNNNPASNDVAENDLTDSDTASPCSDDQDTATGATQNDEENGQVPSNDQSAETQEEDESSEDELISYFANPKLPEPDGLNIDPLDLHSDQPTYAEALNGPYKKEF